MNETYYKKLKELIAIEHNTEQALKLWQNSSYGAMGSNFFYFYNPDVAESITSTGKQIILLTEKTTNDYFLNEWHLDKETHKKLGIENIEIKKLNNPIVCYAHTDSNYLSFGELIDSIGYNSKTEDEIAEFLLKLDSEVLTPMYDKKFKEYTFKNNMLDYLNFETETIARRMVFLAKNINFQNVYWKEGVINKDINLKYTGGKIKSSSTPKFARELLKELYKEIVNHKIENIEMKMLVEKLKEIKKKLFLLKIDDISQTTKVSNYDKYVKKDKDELVLAKGCPYAVSAAAKYNYYLNSQPEEIRKRYKHIKNGKVKIYPLENGYFAYNIGEYPIEFAPSAYRNNLFKKFILEPINSVIQVAFKDANPLTTNLVFSNKLF